MPISKSVTSQWKVSAFLMNPNMVVLSAAAEPA
jgi:hypothetical protein